MYSISSKYLLPTLWTIQVRQAKPIIFAVMLNVKYCPFQNFPKDALHSFFFIFFKSPRQDNLHFTTWIQRKHFCCLLRFRRIPPLISLFLKARVCVDYSSLTKTSTGLLRVGERRQLSGYWGVTLGFTLSCTQVKRSSYNNFWVVGEKKGWLICLCTSSTWGVSISFATSYLPVFDLVSFFSLSFTDLVSIPLTHSSSPPRSLWVLSTCHLWFPSSISSPAFLFFCSLITCLLLVSLHLFLLFLLHSFYCVHSRRSKITIRVFRVISRL